MWDFRFVALLTFAPALAVLTLGGCAVEEEKSAVKKVPVVKEKAPPAKPKTELTAKGWGTIKGKISYAGAPPEARALPTPAEKEEGQARCDKCDNKDQTWKVGPDGGVANVVVWLRAPQDVCFPLPAEQKERKEEVIIDQPSCAFAPRVSILYPSYYDAQTQKQKPTGQKVTIRNSSADMHNLNWGGKDFAVIIGGNVALPAGTSKVLEVAACKECAAGGEQLVTFACNVHPGMKAYAWVFDHPFAAVSTGDRKDAKEFGTFEIPRVPAGVELELVYWHESMSKPVVEKITVKEGETIVKDFKIKE